MGRYLTGIEGQSLVGDTEIRLLMQSIPDDGAFLEIGTWHGATACEIAKDKPRLKVVCVDPFKAGHATLSGDIDIWRKNAQPNMTLFVCTSEEYAKANPNERFDAIFVDGDHSYEWCMRDLMAVMPLLKKDGCLLAHDFCRTHEDTSIARACEDFMKAQCFRRDGRAHTTLRMRRL